MDHRGSLPQVKDLAFQILQCLHGISAWYPQAEGGQALSFLQQHFNTLIEAFKPAQPTETLRIQFNECTRGFGMQIANLTIIHYRKKISDHIHQLTIIGPPVFILNQAVNSAIDKGKKLWGRKLHFLNIRELRELCLNHAWNAERDRVYKEAHKNKFGLSFHVKMFREYTSPYPRARTRENILVRTALIPPARASRPPGPNVSRVNTANRLKQRGGLLPNPPITVPIPPRANELQVEIPPADSSTPPNPRAVRAQTASLSSEQTCIQPNQPVTLPTPPAVKVQPVTRLFPTEMATQTDRMDLVPHSTPINTHPNSGNRDPCSRAGWAVTPSEGRSTRATTVSTNTSPLTEDSSPTAPEFSLPTPVNNEREEQVSSFPSAIFDSPPRRGVGGVTVVTSLDCIDTVHVPSPPWVSSGAPLKVNPGLDSSDVNSFPVLSPSFFQPPKSPLFQRASKKAKDKH